MAATVRAISAVLPARRRLLAPSNSAKKSNAATTLDRLRRGSRRGGVVSIRRSAVVVAGTAADDGLPSLDASSTWRLHFDLFSGKDGGSQTEPDRTVSVTAKFVVDEGYEPPQGVLQIVSDDTGLFADGGLNRWTLEVGSRRIVFFNYCQYTRWVVVFSHEDPPRPRGSQLSSCLCLIFFFLPRQRRRRRRRNPRGEG